MRPEEQGKKLIEDLFALKNDKTIMANLKKGLIEERSFKAWPILRRWCDIENNRERTITLTVAGYFATYLEGHKSSLIRGENNFGTSLRNLALCKNPGISISEALSLNERHLFKLLKCESYDVVCERIGFFIRMMKSNGIFIDFIELYADLCYWGTNVRIRWTENYYGNITEET
jgi:CRISPR type I-E-associated protein CasB/Cse2